VSDETVTFEIPPLSVRLRAIAVLASSLVLFVYALTSAPWFMAKAGGETFVLELGHVRNAPALTTHESTGQAVLMLALLVFGLAYMMRCVFLAGTLLLGRPHLRRGLFRSKLVVAWKTPLRAYVHGAILLAIGIGVAVMLPQLALRESYSTIIPGAQVTYSWGGALFVFGLVMSLATIRYIARDPLLAATQMWGNAFEAPAYESAPAVAKPARRERPMIKSPLPPAPTNVEGAPFREPGAGGGSSLEKLLVRPARPATTPEVKPAADGNADEPSLLR
jgi:hypothetical protein